MIHDAEMEKFDAFCKEIAREIRHKAAALGHPAEYEYLRQYPFILERYREVVPDWGTANMSSVENACCDDSIELDLAEINRIRAEWGEHPLDFVPEVQGKMRFAAPKRKVDPPQDEEEARFFEWAKTYIHNIYHWARANGKSPETLLNSCPWMLVGQVQRLFPSLNPAWCLQQLDFCLLWMKPDVINEELVKSLKVWSDTIKDVGKQIEELAADDKPKFKQ